MADIPNCRWDREDLALSFANKGYIDYYVNTNGFVVAYTSIPGANLSFICQANSIVWLYALVGDR